MAGFDHIFFAFMENEDMDLSPDKPRHCSIPSDVEIETFRAQQNIPDFHNAKITKEARKSVIPQ